MANKASSHALQIPEIVSHILRDVGPGTLTDAIRVNKLWFDCGVPLLWGDGVQFVAQLTRVHGRERRQFYASYLTCLDFRSDDMRLCAEALEDMEFPAVNKICLESNRGCGPLFARLLAPAVSTLYLSDVYWCDADLAATAPRMGHIKQLHMDSSAWAATNEGKAAFLGACRSLEELDVSVRHDQLHNTSFAAVALLPRLRDVRVGGPAGDCPADAFALAAEPFPALQRLTVNPPSRAVPELLRGLARVRRLSTLRLEQEGEVPDLRNMAQLASLRALHLTFHARVPLTRAALAPLRALHGLEDLKIHVEPFCHRICRPRDAVSPMTDADLRELFSGFGRLRKLRLMLKPEMTVVTFLQHLATHCPLLTDCSLGQFVLDLDQLKSIEPLAPNEWFCETLWIGGLAGQPEEQAAIESAVILFREKLPTVRKPCLGGYWNSGFSAYKFQTALRLAIEPEFDWEGYYRYRRP